jgi:hypothetical protein
MDEVRVESDPNKLVDAEWDGLRDRYVTAAFSSRSVIDVCFTSPMIFFTHSSAVKRPQLHTIMGCAENWLDTLDTLDSIGRVAPPALQGIAQAVITEYPELKGPYDKWWALQGPALTAAYDIATKAEFWPCVSAHLHDAAPFMIATHEEHLDDDAEGVAGLEDAPKTTDPNESMFAFFDHVLRVNPGACLQAVLGQAHALALKALATPGDLAARARRKRKRGETADDDAEKVAAWKVTNFFEIPRERRWEIITDIQRRYKELCVTVPKEQLAEHDSTSLQRKRDANDAGKRKDAKRLDKYRQFDHITPIVDAEAMNELDDVETLRDQIRVRLYVYQMKVSTKIGDKTGDEELERLRLGLAKSLATEPLPDPKPGPPRPTRAAHPAPTADAAALDRAYIKQMSEVWGELCELTHAGVFRAPRATRPKRAPRRQDPSPRDQTLVGVDFVENSIAWKVVAVDWSPVGKSVIVWYCDCDMAETTETSMEAMKEFVRLVAAGGNSDSCPPCLEFSSVREVRAWIREC